jgi:anti-sigma B factor antagonist
MIGIKIGMRQLYCSPFAFAFIMLRLIASTNAMGRIRTLEITVRAVDKATIFDLRGSIDLGNSLVLRNKLFETLAAASRLALNMSGVVYLDSSGIATLIEALKKARDLKKGFVLFGLGSRVYDVLKLTNLLGVFQIVESEEQALEADAAP